MNLGKKIVGFLYFYFFKVCTIITYYDKKKLSANFFANHANQGAFCESNVI